MNHGLVERQLTAYREEVESWKADHEDAMACCELEDALSVGIALYHVISKADERWRLRLIDGRETYSKDADDRIAQAYSWWLKPCDRVEAQIKYFQLNGYEVVGAAEFRALHAEALAAARDE